MTDKVLIIGAKTLIGRRLKMMNLPDDCVFTSRTPEADEIALDMEKLSQFVPRFTPKWIVLTIPIWHLSFEALHHFYDLGCERLIAYSSTSRFTKDESYQEAELKIAEKLKAGEERLMAFCAEHHMTYTLLRPTLIYDEGHDGNVSAIAERIKKYGVFPLCGSGKGLRQPVHAEDVAKAALAVLQSLKTKNRAYNLSGADTIPYKEMVKRVFDGVGKPARLISLPSPLWWLALKVYTMFNPIDPTKLNFEMAKRMNRDMIFDHRRAREDFGFAPQGFRPKFSEG